MPRSTKNSACVVNTNVCQDTSIVSKESSSSDVEMEVQSPQFIQPSTNQPHPLVIPMFMPYIEGPKMDWTVNDSFYHRFLKWKLKLENIRLQAFHVARFKEMQESHSMEWRFWYVSICVIVLAA